MKSFFAFIICTLTFVSVFAQTGYNTVTVNYNGQNRQVLIDGRAYTPTASPYGTATNGSVIVTNDLAPGRHTLQVVRNNNRRNTETAFNLRNNYDVTITVSNNGSVQLQETPRRRGTIQGTGNNSMTSANYNMIAQEVQAKVQTNGKVNVLNVAFANTNNSFTTNQVRRLIQMVNGESVRLQLAKASVRSITDTRNIYSLTSLFATQVARNEFADYVRSYSNGQIPGTGTTTTGYETGMPPANFSALYNQIGNMWQNGAKMNAISNAFSSSNNHFSTAQAIQLIQLLSTESERLQMAKASYRTIIDPANFSQVYNLLGTQISRNDLANYVRSIGGTAGTYDTTPAYRTPMADADFSSLIEQIRAQWIPGAKKRAVLNAFANTNYYFTTYQAAQLVQLDNDEADRMDMAKASIRSISDPANIALLYNVFSTQARRDELAEFVRVYNNTYGRQ